MTKPKFIATSQVISEYEQQAIDFCEKTNTKMSIEYYAHGKHFHDDTTTRDIYKITIKRNNKEYTFDFGQSVNHSAYSNEETLLKMFSDSRPSDRSLYAFGKFKKAHSRRTKPTQYAILACVTKYDPYTHENFCADFGYDTDSRKGLETYLAVQKEYDNIYRLFSDVMEELQEIC